MIRYDTLSEIKKNRRMVFLPVLFRLLKNSEICSICAAAGKNLRSGRQKRHYNFSKAEQDEGG